MRVDLHTHTTASDGALAPCDLVEAAQAQGVTVLAVTDHDTLAGVQPAMAAADGSTLRVLAGVEVSALHDGQSIHLLGYGFDPTSSLLITRLRALSQGREERARTIVALLAEAGAPISWERVAAIGKDTIARPHIARVLVEEGYARDIADAFAQFIGDGCPAYLPSGRMSVKDAVTLVRQAGGQVAVAHPLARHPRLDLDLLLPDLLAAGVTGIEVYHSEHDGAATAYLRRLAAEHGLWWSGGSDFHGPTKPHVVLGGVEVPPEVLEQGPFRSPIAVLR
ncbi:MAG TPA: PHP domain-containing protein [Chloroflexota bacterium]|nr:PHP domain-containing protein [Chloroflexota bacterium]